MTCTHPDLQMHITTSYEHDLHMARGQPYLDHPRRPMSIHIEVRCPACNYRANFNARPTDARNGFKGITAWPGWLNKLIWYIAGSVDDIGDVMEAIRDGNALPK